MKPRKSAQDTIREAQRANDLYADLAGKPRLSYEFHGKPLIREPSITVVDERTPKIKKEAWSKTKPLLALESDVQKAIIHYLKLHPKVAWVARFNSGVMRSEYNGRESFTRFSTQAGLSDVLGMMYGGKLFALEVKRPPFSGPRNSREQAQAQFLGDIRAGGGLAGFATSIEDARAILGI